MIIDKLTIKVDMMSEKNMDEIPTLIFFGEHGINY